MFKRMFLRIFEKMLHFEIIWQACAFRACRTILYEKGLSLPEDADILKNERYKFYNGRWWSYMEWHTYMEWRILVEKVNAALYPELYEQQKEAAQILIRRQNDERR